jgi:Zn-dependent membrane protease YugP
MTERLKVEAPTQGSGSAHEDERKKTEKKKISKVNVTIGIMGALGFFLIMLDTRLFETEILGIAGTFLFGLSCLYFILTMPSEKERGKRKRTKTKKGEKR